MQNAQAMRERLFTMRMSEEESTRLDLVAGHYGLNGASLIRMLLKREEAAMSVAPVSPLAARLKRVGAMAKLEAETGVSLACPKFFRIHITNRKYSDAGYHLAIHLRAQIESKEAVEALETALQQGEPETAVLACIQKYLPRCADLVPAARIASFKKGIASAIEEERV